MPYNSGAANAANFVASVAQYALNLHNAQAVGQITAQTHPSTGRRIATVLAPEYVAANDLFQQLPKGQQTIGQRVGMVLLPEEYTALQLAKQKQGGRKPSDVAAALLAPSLYTAFTAKKLNQAPTQASTVH